jgi:hypothetical protein
VYKYTKYTWQGTSNEPNAVGFEGCMLNSEFCGNVNDSKYSPNTSGMKISNPRLILIENIRQSCIYWLTAPKKCSTADALCKQNSLKYWDYMAQFSDTCADLENPTFTEKCSNLIIDNVSLDKTAINGCINSEINTCKVYG